MQLLGDFKGDGLFALGGKGLTPVLREYQPLFPADCHAEFEGIVVGPVHEQDIGAIDEQLSDLAAGALAGTNMTTLISGNEAPSPAKAAAAFPVLAVLTVL